MARIIRNESFRFVCVKISKRMNYSKLKALMFSTRINNKKEQFLSSIIGL